MHERAFPKDSTSTWHNQDSNPGPPDPKAKCLPLDHDATRFVGSPTSKSDKVTENLVDKRRTILSKLGPATSKKKKDWSTEIP